MTAQTKQILRVGNIEFLVKDLTATVKGKPVRLTRTEAQVLHVLMNNPNTTIKREQILMEVWNDTICNTNIVDVYIRRLRVKLEGGLHKPEYIISTRGSGYKLIGG